MAKIKFGIIGGGWRSAFYLRIAKALPEQFEVSGIVVRSLNKGTELEKRWGIKAFLSVDELLRISDQDFVVVSVPSEVAPVIIKEITVKGNAVLTETPPAPDLESLVELNKLVLRGARIQVAEQYHLQPMHAARISIVNSKKLGEISQVQISVCHGYHALSLIRKLLGIGFENATISAFSTTTPLIGGPGRNGAPDAEVISDSNQVLAHLDFVGKHAVYDFNFDQYFSWIRSQRLLVQGCKGEINDTTIRYLKDYKTPVELDLKRQSAGENGNLEGYYLKGILAGEEWVYANPLIPARLTDDEIAVASCLLKMYQYTKTGTEFYSLAEASQDHYISMMIEKALNTGEKIKTESQTWSR